MKFAKADWDSAAVLTPSNQTAARATGKGGDAFELRRNANDQHSTELIPFRRPTRLELLNAAYYDLSGAKYGRFTVLGVAVGVGGKTKQNWVVKCVCGCFETRKAKAIKRYLAAPQNYETVPCCDWCKKTAKLRAGQGKIRLKPHPSGGGVQ